jgi:hypothetical protein
MQIVKLYLIVGNTVYEKNFTPNLPSSVNLMFIKKRKQDYTTNRSSESITG